jgi:hypothetical protein
MDRPADAISPKPDAGHCSPDAFRFTVDHGAIAPKELGREDSFIDVGGVPFGSIRARRGLREPGLRERGLDLGGRRLQARRQGLRGLQRVL